MELTTVRLEIFQVEQKIKSVISVFFPRIGAKRSSKQELRAINKSFHLNVFFGRRDEDTHIFSPLDLSNI